MIDFDFKSINIKRVLTLAFCLYLVYLIPSLIVANIAKGTPKCSCCKHKTQLTFWTCQLNSQEDYFKKLIKKFEHENPDIKVSQLVKEKGAKINRFARFETGEGIEKKEENFAEEVAKQLQ